MCREIRSVPSGAVVNEVGRVLDRGDGSFDVMVRVGAAGEYAMGVSVGGIEMTGSPFAFSLLHDNKLRECKKIVVIVSGAECGKLMAYRYTSFIVCSITVVFFERQASTVLNSLYRCTMENGELRWHI
jgi:hypothetical protein